MTPDLHDRIEELVADVPAYVVPDARAAWAAGARRRTRHRVGVLAAAAIVVALLAGAVAWLPRTLEPAPAEPDGGTGVDGYPARVVNPWVVRDLPMAPGPMAMVLQQSDGSWWVANAEGRSWRVPQHDLEDDYPPALSPDGRWLGYVRAPRTYMVQDLVTGDADTGFSLDEEASAPWLLGQQAPGFWSPSGRHLLLRTGGTADAVVLDPVSTFNAEIRHPGYPAGWLDEDTTAWLVTPETGHQARLVGVDLKGRTVSSVALDLGNARASYLSQWSASISPDGRRVAVVDAQGAVRLYRLSDGKLTRYAPVTASDTCSASWEGNRPVVYAANQLQTLTGVTVTAFDVGDETTCAMAAADALVGGPNPGLGWWEQLADWAPHHVGVVAVWVALVAALLGLLIAGRRRRRLERTS